MKVKYLGPRQVVEVSPYGSHWAGEIKDYPEAFARDLAATSSRQRFELVEPQPEPNPAPAPKPRRNSFRGKQKRSKDHEQA